MIYQLQAYFGQFYKKILLLTFIFCFSTLKAFDCPSEDLRPLYNEFENFSILLQELDENATIEQVVDLVFQFRDSLINRGYPVPKFSEIFQMIEKDEIDLDRSFIDEDVFDFFFEEIIKREKACSLMKKAKMESTKCFH